jgi:hypothetical protein
MERFNLKTLQEVVGKEKYSYRVEVSNTLAALKYLDAVVDVDNVWTSHGSSKDVQNYYIKGSKANFQGLGDPSEINRDTVLDPWTH